MRLDKYLKTARILKRREAAKELALQQRVEVNGRIVKPSYEVEVGDRIVLRFGTRILEIRVLDIQKQVSKANASLLFEVISEKRLKTKNKNHSYFVYFSERNENMKITDRLEEIKVMRDPIHSYIHIEYALLWKIIDTPEMQRLRRIHQLGGNFQVYHTAEHSRFSHSLGVYEIVRRMLSEIPSLVQEVSEQEKIVLMAASLVHDIGHGPFSHLFERITHKHHETMGKEILLDPSTGIHKLLVQYDQDLPDQIVSILERRHPKRSYLKYCVLSSMRIGWITCFVIRTRQERVMENLILSGSYELYVSKMDCFASKKAACIRSKITSWLAMKCIGKCIYIPMRKAMIF